MPEGDFSVTALYVSASCLQSSLSYNPNRPPSRFRRGWRAPFRFEVCRWVLTYRLLSFDVKAVSTITGVSVKNVKTILQIFGGHMPRRGRGFGSIIYDRGYAICNDEAFERLALPSFCPKRVDKAYRAPRVDGVDVMTFTLPEPYWRPDYDGYSDWQRGNWLK
jgi:hypothetical protein